MSNKTSIIALAALALLAASCGNDHENGAVETAKYITVNTSIGALSRTTTADDGTQVFEKDDAISVYVWTGTADAINTSGLVVNNSINTYDGTSAWTPAPQMLWKDMTSAHFFLGIYPAREVSDFTADAYALDLTKSQEVNDLLVAVNTGTDKAGLTASATAVPLQFDHVMAKLIVNLTFRDQWGGTPTVESVTTSNLKSKATVDYVAKRVAVTSDAATDIQLLTASANASYQSVMVPQEGAEARIAVKIGEKNYIYTGTVTLESGKYTTVNLIVGRDAITLGSVSINNWGVGETINGGEAQED